MKPLAKSKSKFGFFLKLLFYSFIYGTIFINWIDLIFGPAKYGYHLWLTFMYFLPFFVVLIFRGLEDWELMLGFGLFTSLMNDLLYYVVGKWLFGFRFDLLEWYRCQLLPVCDKGVVFDFLFFKLRPYPYLMPLSIYSRIVAVYLLLYKWWREAELRRRVEEWRRYMLENPPPEPINLGFENIEELDIQ